MHTMLTVFSGLILISCLWVAIVTMRMADAARKDAEDAASHANKLSAERARVTVLERETDALRRELRKLSGKFYASQRTLEEQVEDMIADADDPQPYRRTDIPANVLPVCQNWLDAKQAGPQSTAAKCECEYCAGQRRERARLRAELVPRTVQGQAELARINAGKP